ncbi:MAG: choice-of-anchor U domain-containing protein [Dehalococcoidia bacterium]
MRKIFSILFALALVLSFSLVMATPVAAATINVPGDQPTIQAAIAAANPGDTINVAAGTYNEGVSIPSGKDGLEIAGTNAIVDGTGLGDVNGFSIASDNVKIHGFTIQNFVVSVQGASTNMKGWGIITVAGTSGGELYDNTITSASGGIYILASTNYEVYDNNINNIAGDFPYHGHGIIVYSSGPAQGAISGNIIGKLGHPNTISDTDVATPGYFGCGQGIYVGSDNVLTLLVDAHGTKVEYNIVSNVKSKALQVSGVTTASTVDVNHNQISGSKLWGLDIMYCGVVNVNNNAFSGMTDFQVVRASYDAANPGNCLTGAEMYDIFKNNGNTFDKAAAAVVPAGNEINTSLANSNYRYIQSDIQDAIDDAHNGYRVEVLAGTYTEAVTINPGADLTIQGVGRDVTTWIAPADDPSRMHCIQCALTGYAGTTTLDISGFTFSVEDNLTSDSGIAILINRADTGPLYLDIHDNKFVETTTIPIETANSMLLCHNRYAARVGGVAPVKIHDNLDYTTGGIAMSNTRAFDIYNNTFDGGSDALYIGYGCPTSTTIGDHHIYNNTFKNADDTVNGRTDGPWPAIFFSYYGSGTGMTFLPSTIENNTFEDNDVAIGYSMESGITYPADVIHFNNFDNNTEAVRVFGTYATTVDAENNWWGADSGPNDPNDEVGENTEVPPCNTVTGAAMMNTNGTGDKVEGNVDYCPWIAASSVGTATGTGTASFVATGGPISGLTAVAEGTLPTAGKPNLVFPHGFFSFDITGLTPGDTVTVTITLPPGAAPTQYWKYHPNTQGGWVQIPMVVVGPPNVIRITLVDGGLGDDDGNINGTIVDQGGPGNPGAVGWETYPINKVRVLLPWIALFAAIIAGASLLVVRRRRA